MEKNKNKSGFVTTVLGDEVKRTSCKLMGGEYYLIGRDVHLIDEKYVKDSLLVFDINTGQKAVLGRNVSHCLNSNLELVASSDTLNVFVDRRKIPFLFKLPASVIINSYQDFLLIKMDKKSFLGSGEYLERDSIEFSHIFGHNADSFVHKSALKVLDTLQLRSNRRGPKIYRVEGSPFSLEAEGNLKSTSDFDKYKEFLEDYTFGVELETVSGNILTSKITEHGFVPLYDGSISGWEYASKIMTYKNINQIREFMGYLTLNHKTDYNCSTHIHVGNIPYNETNLLAFHYIFQKLQDELHEMVYPYKKSTNYLAGKPNYKDHCKYLYRLIKKDSVEEIKERYFSWTGLNQNKFNTEESEQILERTQKWDVLSRYYFVNFTNYVMKKNGTIELRLLQGTFNFRRLFFWLLINVGIINKVLKNPKAILEQKEKFELSDIMEEMYPKEISKGLIVAINELKNSYMVDLKVGELRMGQNYFDTFKDDDIGFNY